MQGVEVAMYTAWYLAESFQTIKFINTLLKEKVFYIVMTISPDGRKILFINRITLTALVQECALDNDGDGLVNEDG
jgi:hypothetical protein